MNFSSHMDAVVAHVAVRLVNLLTPGKRVGRPYPRRPAPPACRGRDAGAAGWLDDHRATSRP
jgi:hypothetical protein